MKSLARALLLCGTLTAIAAGQARSEGREGIVFLEHYDGGLIEACQDTNAAIVRTEDGWRIWCAAGDVITPAAAEACQRKTIDLAFLFPSWAEVECDEILTMDFPANDKASPDHVLQKILAEIEKQTMYLKHLCRKALGTLEDCTDL